MITEIGKLKVEIDRLWEVGTLPGNALSCLEAVLDGLDSGSIAVVERQGDGSWSVNSWVKKAILLYFRLKPVEKLQEGPFWDKIPLRHLSSQKNRIVPFSSIRRGSYIADKVVVMAPSFVNIGAYIDEGTMVDSLVLVGSCARVGKNVHLGAGTTIGGVLEPPNSRPVIIEDDVFVGGNCGIYEGCLIESGAVIAAGTIITAATPIIDVETGEKFSGRVPATAVVVPGGRIRNLGFPGEKFVLQTPLIVKRRDPATTAKIALEDSLRSFEA